MNAALNAYVDTSVVTRWYVLEDASPSALKIRKKLALPLPFPPWLRLELSNAWSLKVFRGDISAPQMGLAHDALEEDVRAGFWRSDAVDVERAHALALAYAERHTPFLGARSMDVLHVAAAMSAACKRFVTGDRRQASLAEHVGMSVTIL